MINGGRADGSIRGLNASTVGVDLQRQISPGTEETIETLMTYGVSDVLYIIVYRSVAVMVTLNTREE